MAEAFGSLGLLFSSVREQVHSFASGQLLVARMEPYAHDTRTEAYRWARRFDRTIGTVGIVFEDTLIFLLYEPVRALPQLLCEHSVASRPCFARDDTVLDDNSALLAVSSALVGLVELCTRKTQPISWTREDS
eukprot:COSAG02_NODE_27130_length_616_cov_1.226306_2_plen_132_part_01